MKFIFCLEQSSFSPKWAVSSSFSLSPCATFSPSMNPVRVPLWPHYLFHIALATSSNSLPPPPSCSSMLTMGLMLPLISTTSTPPICFDMGLVSTSSYLALLPLFALFSCQRGGWCPCRLLPLIRLPPSTCSYGPWRRYSHPLLCSLSGFTSPSLI